jgi:hypothetical protein
LRGDRTLDERVQVYSTEERSTAELHRSQIAAENRALYGALRHPKIISGLADGEERPGLMR